MKPPSSFRIVPHDADLVARIRRTMTDDFGHSLRVTTSTDQNPCRFTLQLAAPGEELILLSYSPFTRDHPYREIGPIFIRRQGVLAMRTLTNFHPNSIRRKAFSAPTMSPKKLSMPVSAPANPKRSSPSYLGIQSSTAFTSAP